MKNYAISNNEGGLTEFQGALVYARSDALTNTNPDYEKTMYLYFTDKKDFVLVREKLNRPQGKSINKVIREENFDNLLDELISNKLGRSFVSGLLKKLEHLTGKEAGSLEMSDIKENVLYYFGDSSPGLAAKARRETDTQQP
ncbi:MAG: hypothetical protein HLX50_14460 [Alteromonadaceae bacterium]|nr:hypothetical protein [Alteromonadaceae bacterium]